MATTVIDLLPGGGGGGGAWGSITGTIGDQTDLASALADKLDAAEATAFGLTLIGAANASAGRTALGLGTMSTEAADDYLTKSGNLTGLGSTSASRTNLGLGTVATQNSSDVDFTGGRVQGLNRFGVTGATAAVTIGVAGQTFQVTSNLTSLRVSPGGSGGIDSDSSASSGIHVRFASTHSSAGGALNESLWLNRTTPTGVYNATQMRKEISSGGAFTNSDTVRNTTSIVGSNGTTYAFTDISVWDAATKGTCYNFGVTKNSATHYPFSIGRGKNGVMIGSDIFTPGNRLGLLYDGASGYDLIFPATSGSAGQVLSTDGTGVCSWATPSGGGGGVQVSHVKTIFTNVSVGSYGITPPNSYVASGAHVNSDGRCFYGITDGTSNIIYTSPAITGAYTEIIRASSSSAWGILYDIGPSGDGLVYYRPVTASSWQRWNGSAMVAVTTHPAVSAVNQGRGIGYNGNFFYIAFGGATIEQMRYSMDNGATWSSGSTSWFHTPGAQMSSSRIAVGFVNSGATAIAITEINSSPTSANVSYGAINGTPSKFLLPSGYVNILAYDSDGTIMAVLFSHGGLSVTSDGSTWTHTSLGNANVSSGLGCRVKIRSSDIIVFYFDGAVYSISHDLSTVNWVRTFRMVGGSHSVPPQSTWASVIAGEIYYAVWSSVSAGAGGYNSGSIEKVTFS